MKEVWSHKQKSAHKHCLRVVIQLYCKLAELWILMMANLNFWESCTTILIVGIWTIWSQVWTVSYLALLPPDLARQCA